MKIEGMIPPLVTPLSDRDVLDRDGLEQLLEHVVAGGVDGVFILGTTGEAPSLSYRLRRELVEVTCSIINKRVPVLVGVTDTSAIESLQLAGRASDCGADAVVLAMPYYFPAGQSEILNYLREITPQLPLPVFLYNMPAMTKLTLEIDTLRELVDIDNIKGLKDSSGDIAYYKELLELTGVRADWRFFSGSESQLVESVRMGGDGGVCGGANLFPQLFSDAWQAASRGDFECANELGKSIEVLQRIYSVGDYASRYVKATKCGLSLLGICGDCMEFPFNRFNEEKRARVKWVLERMDRAIP